MRPPTSCTKTFTGRFRKEPLEQWRPTLVLSTWPQMTISPVIYRTEQMCFFQPGFNYASGVLFPVQYSQCIWDRDTDELTWYPMDIKACTRKYSTSLIDSHFNVFHASFSYSNNNLLFVMWLLHDFNLLMVRS